MIFYGVFTFTRGPEDGPEALLRIEETPQAAIAWMARFFLFRAYGAIETETLKRTIDFLDKLLAEARIDVEVEAEGSVFFVRPVTKEELEEIGDV
ncbi:MAG: hypothetical protein AB7U75_13855 [Hyphomicrobiaceae bacterium]